MVINRKVVHGRIASVIGVPSAIPPTPRRPEAPPATLQRPTVMIPERPPATLQRPTVMIPERPPATLQRPTVRTPEAPPKHPPLKRIRIIKERGDLTKSGYIYKAMTNLGEKASQLNYNVVQRGPRGEEIIQKVTNKQTTPEGEISGTISELVYPTVPSEIRESREAPVRVPKVYIKWEEQQIGEDTYAKGRSPGYFVPPRALPKPRPPVTAPVTPVVTPKPPVPPKPPVRTPERPPVTIQKPPVKIPQKEDTRKITLEMAGKIARPLKRKLSARVEELMEKRGFPKAVKEAIEKGLERKDAPRDIEQIIEKVAETNEPDYLLRRTIAKRMVRGGIVQYKVDTDKGTIIYENADEKDTNAILGMPTPTGEVIPLQIKVIR